MARHSFIRMTKLTDVCGRVDYISSPARQEHLYAVYSTTQTQFWKELSRQAQFDHWRSHQDGSKCIEARELIIALPEFCTQYDPDQFLKLYTEAFHRWYGVECTAALHHNKTKTNYHIHLIFADRVPLQEKQVKIASRNMFYDENGRHVRTKKEIMDADGKVRKGCRIIAKGEPYEVRYFSARKEIFKSREFLAEVKKKYTRLINKGAREKGEKLQVFQEGSPYLPTRKIGKNNPLEKEIRVDNALRQEWNRTVDQILDAGGRKEEVTEFKQKVVQNRIDESEKVHGYQPGLFAGLMQRAIEVLAQFLEILKIISERFPAGGRLLRADSDLIIEYTERQKRLRKAQAAFSRIEAISQKAERANRRAYAIGKAKKKLEGELEKIPRGFFHRKERREKEKEISDKNLELKKAERDLQMLPAEYGYQTLDQIRSEYKRVSAELKTAKKLMTDIEKEAWWERKNTSDQEKERKAAEHGSSQKENSAEDKESILMRLAEKKKLVEERDRQRNSSARWRGDERE